MGGRTVSSNDYIPFPFLSLRFFHSLAGGAESQLEHFVKLRWVSPEAYCQFHLEMVMCTLSDEL